MDAKSALEHREPPSLAPFPRRGWRRGRRGPEAHCPASEEGGGSSLQYDRRKKPWSRPRRREGDGKTQKHTPHNLAGKPIIVKQRKGQAENRDSNASFDHHPMGGNWHGVRKGGRCIKNFLSNEGIARGEELHPFLKEEKRIRFFLQDQRDLRKRRNKI